MSEPVMKLNIADIIIGIESRFPHADLAKLQKEQRFSERYRNFFSGGDNKPHVFVKVEIVKKLPEPKKVKDIFITYHPDDQQENWRLLQQQEGYIYKSPLKGRKQLMVINKTMDKVTAYLLPKAGRHFIWDITDIIYDFLQVFLITYLSAKNLGVFVHGVGIKDGERGLLFAGKSGAGKTTTAKIWHKHSDAMILNDDRIIVRKIKDRFFMYGTPWHGTFDDYLYSRIESALLEKLFFIHKAKKNAAKPITALQAFKHLYPTVLPPFWDKHGLAKVAAFCEDMVEKVCCFNFAFVKNKSIISFIRSR